MARLTGDLILRTLDDDGLPVSGGLVKVYENGTTTPITTYSNAALTTAHAWPIVANSSGVVAPIYVPAGRYRVALETSAAAALPGSPVDNVLAEQDATTYTGDMTIDPDDDWVSIINFHDGQGTITLADGLYETAEFLEPRGPKLFVAAQNLKDATIRARWRIRSTQIQIDDCVLEPTTAGGMMIDGNNCLVRLVDCDINAGAFTGDTAVIRGQGMLLRAAADAEDALWTIGGSATLGISIDGVGGLKIAANTSSARLKIRLDATVGNVGGLVTPSGRSHLFGVHFEKIAGDNQATGVRVWRGSQTLLTDDCEFDGVDFCVTAQQGSTVDISETHFANATRAMQRQSGAIISYDPDTVTFDAVTTQILDEHADDRVLAGGFFGLAPHVVQFASATVVASGATTYIGLGTKAATDVLGRQVIPFTGTLKNLRVVISGAAGSGASFTMTLFVNGVAESIATTISGASDSIGTDLVNTKAVTAGDTVSLRVVASGSATARTVTAVLTLERTA